MGSASGSDSGSASGSSVVSGFGVVSTTILTILYSYAVVTLSVVVVVVVVGYSVEFLKLATAADGVVVSWLSARVVMFPTTMILPIWSVLSVVVSGSSVVARTCVRCWYQLVWYRQVKLTVKCEKDINSFT